MIEEHCRLRDLQIDCIMRTSQPNNPSEDIPSSSSMGDIASPRQINDSVYELYSPSATPKVEIIFFHGIQPSNNEDAYWTTWLDRERTLIWPRTWLSESIPTARILAVSYASSAPKEMGRSDSSIIFENLVYDIIESAGVGQNCPVVLVGHSLGGIIIKGFLMTCVRTQSMLSGKSASYNSKVQSLDKFMNNCKGIFYYATPQAGSPILVSFIDNFEQKDGPLVLLLKILNKETARINEDFRKFRHGKLDMKSFSMNESLPPEKQDRLLVPEASARSDVDASYTVRANHFEVSRPKTSSDPIITKLVQFVHDVVPEVQIID